MNTHQKVLFYTHPVDGHPPEEWEAIWTIPLGANKFKLDNIPFYTKGISCDDVIEADLSSGSLIFKRLVQSSPNSTVRVIVYDERAVDKVNKHLRDIGCSVEGTGIPGYLAINVPQTSLDAALQYLKREFDEDRLDYEEGVIRR
jgi:hypothetical protein